MKKRDEQMWDRKLSDPSDLTTETIRPLIFLALGLQCYMIPDW